MPISRITSHRNQEKLPQDLEKYREYALKLGATEAQVVNTSKIPVEDAVAFKCRVPQCSGYNNCAQCPPYALKPAEIRQLLKGYGNASVCRSWRKREGRPCHFVQKYRLSKHVHIDT